MNNYKIILAAAIQLLLLISAVGCGSPQAQSSATPATSTGAIATLVQNAQIPDGTYIRGFKYLKLTSGHHEMGDKSTNVMRTKGSYTVAGEQVTFTDEELNPQDPWICYEPPKTYSYRWAFDGNALTLTNINDTCGLRVNVYTQVPWSYTGSTK